MKHKISFLLLGVLLAGCSVELKDKQSEPVQVEAMSSEPDYVIDAPLLLTTHTKIEADRVVLTRNAVITTEDKNLVIITKELVVDGAVIQNFPEGAAAYWEKSGRAGGTVSVDALKARGTLEVRLNGERGGSGKNGCITAPGHHPGCAGTDGAMGGNAGSLRVEIANNDAFNLNWINQPGFFGPAGVRGSVPMGTPADAAVYPPCDRDTRDGVNGQSGTKGQVCVKLGSEERLRCQE